MSDRFGSDYAVGDARIQDYLSQIDGEYAQAYYTGIVYERRAKAMLKRGEIGSESTAFELFRSAMNWFERAETVRPAGNADVILRWNGCARVIMMNNLKARQMAHDFIE